MVGHVRVCVCVYACVHDLVHPYHVLSKQLTNCYECGADFMSLEALSSS